MPVGTPPIKLSIAREYLATLTMALQSLGPVLLVGNAFFLAARFGNQAIPEVLPNDAVLLEFDQDRRLAAFLIGDELDSGHASILPARISLGHRTAPRRSGQARCLPAALLRFERAPHKFRVRETRNCGLCGSHFSKSVRSGAPPVISSPRSTMWANRRVRIQKFVGGYPPYPKMS